MSSKQVDGWVVLGPNSEPCGGTWHTRQQGAIDMTAEWYWQRTWQEMLKLGYRCVPATLTVEASPCQK